MQVLVNAQNSMGAIVLGPMDVPAALHRTTQLRSDGFWNIKIVDPQTGAEADIERFMIDKSSQSGSDD